MSINYAMTLTGNNREERKRNEPFGDRTPVPGLQGIQYRSKLFVHLHAVIPRLCRWCLPRNGCAAKDNS